MRNILIWTAVFLLPLGIVGGMERRYQALDRELSETVQRYERWVESVMADNAQLEKKLHQVRLNRSRPVTDLTAREYLDLLADYLAADGRCEVVIEKIDWSSWRGAHR